MLDIQVISDEHKKEINNLITKKYKPRLATQTDIQVELEGSKVTSR